MINCGGCFNVLELLLPENDVKFYIIDRYLKRRSLNQALLYNFYVQLQTTTSWEYLQSWTGTFICYTSVHLKSFISQVNVLVREDDRLDIPEFEDIFAYMVCIRQPDMSHTLYCIGLICRMKVRVKKMNTIVTKTQVLVKKEEKWYG